MEALKIHVHGQADKFNGWGLHTTQAINFLSKSAHVTFSHHTQDDLGGRVYHPYGKSKGSDCILQISPVTMDVIENAIVWTMHEASHISPQCVSFLQKSKAILVPSMWNMTGFKQSGVTKPIFMARLGYDNSLFNFVPKTKKDTFTFGVGGSISGAGERKEVQKAIDAFHALPQSWVRLSIKIMPWDQINTHDDSRITVFKEIWPDHWMAQWYHFIDCFVSASRGEGVGLMPLQAMVCGCEVVAPLYGGHLSYMQPHHVYSVPFSIVEADSFYVHGQQCRIETHRLTQTMQDVASFVQVEPDVQRLERSKKRSESLSHLTWNNSVSGVLDTIREVLLT